MRRVRVVVLAALAVAMLAVAAGAPSAMASLGECEFEHVCLWDNPEFQGQIIQYPGPKEWTNLSERSFNDRASSTWNTTSFDARLSENAGGGGRTICLKSGETRSGLGTFNNEASAIKIFKTANVC